MAIKLNAEKRDRVGKYIAFDLRKAGRIPAVMYGQGIKENVYLSVNGKEFKQVAGSGSRLLDLSIDGKTQMAVIKDVQHETIGSGIVHIDFRAISETTTLHLDVEIILKGDAKGAATGGIIEQNLHRVTLECLPRDLPTSIELDITELDIGRVLFVSDLPLLNGVKYVTLPTIPVVSCQIKGEEKPATTEAVADATATDAAAKDAKVADNKPAAKAPAKK